MREAVFFRDPLWPEEWIDTRNLLHWHRTKVYGTRPLQDVTRIVIHHVGVETKLEGIQLCQVTARFHVQDKGYPGIGYHFMIPRTGGIFLSNAPEVISYHCGEIYNPSAIGICLEGKFTEGVEPTYHQFIAAFTILQGLRELGINWTLVQGHRELRPTDCPGDSFLGPVGWKARLFSEELGEAREKIQSMKATFQKIIELAQIGCKNPSHK